MAEDVSNLIEQLRLRLGVETDAELAKGLRIDKSTISSWRSRGAVPGRYLSILGGAAPQTYETSPKGWGDYEVMAFRLALFRYCRARADVAQTSDFPTILQTFSFEHGFFHLMALCQSDLAQKIGQTSVPLVTAFALVLHEYVAAGAAGAAADLELFRREPNPKDYMPGQL
jgi:hypothetical protein